MKMKKDTAVLYVHGKGGSAAEAEHYRLLFPDADVTGFDDPSGTPWETGPAIHQAVWSLREHYREVILVANSIGAFFSMHGGLEGLVSRAYLISPVVDMERLIRDMMLWAGVDEEQLRREEEIPTAFGETLSWRYLTWVREHPARWQIPTAVLYGERDHLISMNTITAFAGEHGASLTVMPGGEHWFHTPEQMAFLDRWIVEAETPRRMEKDGEAIRQGEGE